MTLNRNKVMVLLYRLGFTEAHLWDEATLRKYAQELPNHFTREQIPKKFQDLYDKLEQVARRNDFIHWEVKPFSKPKK